MTHLKVQLQQKGLLFQNYMTQMFCTHDNPKRKLGFNGCKDNWCGFVVENFHLPFLPNHPTNGHGESKHFLT
jgi:hypothetical protein